ncbi:hypothetical protein DL93DRAFT_1097589 [Clavulina sp. PMI_390]|nr:hypothetical protein DL93DRAFT_1097589 [Clavulina sp. PMI_390]
MPCYIDLPLEIRLMVSDYLKLYQLKRYAASCRCFAEEASPRLWKNISIDPSSLGDEGIAAFVHTLLLNPVKASYVRHIRIRTMYFSPGDPYSIFRGCSSSTDDPLWPRLTAAFRLLVRIETMTISIPTPNFVNDEAPSQTQRMVECLVGARLTKVQSLQLRSPTQALVDVCQAWPALQTVVIHQYRPYCHTLSPSILPNLSRIQAHLPWLEQLVPGRPIEQILLPPASIQYKRSSEDVETFSRVISQCQSLRHLRIHQIRAPGKTLELKFAHPKISTFELVLHHGNAITEEKLSAAVTATLDEILQELPALRILRIVYVHRAIPASIDVDAWKMAFDELFTSIGHRMRSIRVEVWGSTYQVSKVHWINAERTDFLRWEVQAGTASGMALLELALNKIEL